MGDRVLIDGQRWLDDPANPRKAWDGFDGFNSLLTLAEEAETC